MYMGGVDKLDQMLETYLSLRKTVKWYKKFFQHLLDVTVYNSFVLFKLKNPSSKSKLVDFRTELIAHIIARHHSGHRHLGGRPAGSGDAPTRLTEPTSLSIYHPHQPWQVPRENAEFVGHQRRMENESGSRLDICVLAAVV